jgi:hypothetical protein
MNEESHAPKSETEEPKGGRRGSAAAAGEGLKSRVPALGWIYRSVAAAPARPARPSVGWRSWERRLWRSCGPSWPASLLWDDPRLLLFLQWYFTDNHLNMGWLCNKKYGVVNMLSSAVCCWGLWKLKKKLPMFRWCGLEVWRYFGERWCECWDVEKFWCLRWRMVTKNAYIFLESLVGRPGLITYHQTVRVVVVYEDRIEELQWSRMFQFESPWCNRITFPFLFGEADLLYREPGLWTCMVVFLQCKLDGGPLALKL